ncbi:membrane protein YczE [Nocardioides montaniterrae]
MSSTIRLAPLGPLEQLRAGRLGRRIPQLLVGLWIYGLSMAMMIRSGLGLDPWDVFHAGIAAHVDLTFGTIVVITGAFVLLLWIPIRQAPGLGTITNVILIGVATDVSLATIDRPAGILARTLLLLGGIGLNGLAGALYIGAQLGPGPRDGLMTGLVARTGWPIRVVRTGLEVTVLVIGFLLGGTVGLGTVLYAVAIGPIVQELLPRLLVELDGQTPADLGLAVEGSIP